MNRPRIRNFAKMFDTHKTTWCQKNEPTLPVVVFNNRALILIIFGKQHQNTFANDMHIQLSLFLHLYLFYLLLAIAATERT